MFATGFDHPVLVTHAPGDPRAVYVLEQPGRVIRLENGRRTVFLDIRRDVQYLGEQGLLGLAFDPEVHDQSQVLHRVRRNPVTTRGAVSLGRWAAGALEPDAPPSTTRSVYETTTAET